MVFIQRLHPMALKPKIYRRIPDPLQSDNIPQFYTKGISFESYKDVTLDVNVQAVIETGWAIKLSSKEFATIHITNDFLTPVSVIEKFLPIGFEGPLNACIQNTSRYRVNYVYGTPLITICIFEIKRPTFTIVQDILDPLEEMEADSTS